MEVTIERTNQLAVHFNGHVIGRGTNRYKKNGVERRKWLAVELYQAVDDKGAFFVAVLTMGSDNGSREVSTEEARDPAKLLSKLARPDYRYGGRKMFIHPSIRCAFNEADKVSSAGFNAAMIKDLT